MRVTCPACRRETEFSARNAWRPFCSQRCKSTDLGAWAAGDYRIAGEAPGDDADVQGGDSGDSGFSSRPSA